ncbi:MAG TPA: 1-(5-phosphoribosyl)-5-[(5-phosphoribosylamino)methylideneamino]imidazole-4-carboxamide isomerase [Gemmatimonadales bacterium]
MEFFPAIDLRAGRVVRLRQGDAAHETSYGADPVAQAERFVAAGARWIHVVDLDRAFGTGENLAVVRGIAAGMADRVQLQVGGGIRSLDALRAVLDLGVTRAVLGTAAVDDPALVSAALALAGPARLAIGLDTRGRRVAVRGWVETTPLLAVEVCRRVLLEGAETVIHTDVSRDGTLTGPDLQCATQLKDLGAAVIASGGISSVNDLRAVRDAGLAGVIVGRALYEGRFTVAEALAAI